MGSKKAIATSEASQPGGAYSQAIATEQFIFAAGQVASDPVAGEPASTLEDQVGKAIDNLEAVLRAAGVGLSEVVKTTCFLADIRDFEKFNECYKRRFPQPMPARSTMGVALADNILVEIEAVALRAS